MSEIPGMHDRKAGEAVIKGAGNYSDEQRGWRQGLPFDLRRIAAIG
jgi:hypothetical protein